jgi:Helix-turn-helix domain
MASKPDMSRSASTQRADKLFALEVHDTLDSPFVERIWRTRSVPAESFISVAATNWEMVVTRQYGKSRMTVRGPETKATTLAIPRDADWVGVEFRSCAFMPGLPAGQLVDGSIELPGATDSSFWFAGSVWEVPDYENMDYFVRRLVRAGLLIYDPVVRCALDGDPTKLSLRSVQRRVRRVTGLTRTAIFQIERAHKAVALLDRGAGILDTVEHAGYADQSHLTRALKRFIGQTPAELVKSASKRCSETDRP